MTGISIACRQLLRAIRCRADLEQDDFSSNRHLALAFCLSMISAQTLRVCREGKPLHTFPDHAVTVQRIRCRRSSAASTTPRGTNRAKAMLILVPVPGTQTVCPA